jgi:opacity protein-like surface antigen
MKAFFLSLVIVLFAFFGQAQNFHLNLYTGFSNYQGDLQDKRFTLNQAHLAGGLGFSYDIATHFSIRTGLTFAKVSGDDKDGRNKTRNLNFSSGITEANIGLEYYITAPIEKHSLTPYLFAGVALYHYNPYTYDTTGRKYYLQPLSTEGEGFVAGRSNYKLTQFAIPFGAGVKLSLSDNVNVGLEFGYRKLFTDYLDDVSTTYVDEGLLLANRGAKAVELAYRGDELKNGNLNYPPAGEKRGQPGNTDAYYFTMLTLSFRLGGGGLGSMEYRCPGNVL